MSIISNARDALAPGGKNGLPGTERRDPIGYLVAGLGLLAQAPVLDRLGLRAPAQDAVFRVTSAGFRTLGASSRVFTRRGAKGPGTRVGSTVAPGVFDLTPTEDQQMLLDVVGELAREQLRPAATDADAACAAPDDLLRSTMDIGMLAGGGARVARGHRRGAVGDDGNTGPRGAGQG